MRITPLDVHEQTFRMTFRGFDPVEVDGFLQRVADELERLYEERDSLRTELEKEKRAREAVEDGLATTQRLHEDVIQSAHEQAEVLRRQAQLQADRILAEADQELLRLRREAEQIKEMRSMWLAELAALGRTLSGWVEGKTQGPESGPRPEFEPEEEDGFESASPVRRREALRVGDDAL